MNFVLIDDHQLVRDGFKRLIETNGNWRVVAEAGNISEGKIALSAPSTDVAIIDISLSGDNGLDIVKYSSEFFPHIKTIVVSMYDQNPYVTNALEAGVKGFISKRSASDELLDGINSVINGNTYLSQDVLNKLHTNKSDTSTSSGQPLTERELMVLPLLAKGLNAKNIAKILGIMPKTAHVHRANINKKLAVNNNFELLKIALNMGLVNLNELTES